jgi:outer membrane receptor protein involved in Fe transport
MPGIKARRRRATGFTAAFGTGVRAWAAGSASAAALLAAGAAAEERTDAAMEPVAYDIAAQDLADALGAFAIQSHLQLMFDPALVEGRTSPPLQGRYRPAEALARLLEDSGVEAGPAAGDALTLRAAAATSPEGGEDPDPAEDGSPPFRAPVSGADRAPAASGEPEVITVTGTHIRGVAPVGSQLFVIDREELDRLGVGTVQDAVRTLPQNFGGGVGGEDRRINTGGAPVNTSGGAGVNLRGLGGDSTLVLVNGRRLPQGAAPAGQFVDISTIPLSAVERIEVLPDGASALYGSDAIAGVVNFVLRQDYEGAETRARFGSVTDGGLRELGFSHVQGFQGDRFNLLAGYEFFDRRPLAAADRDYAADSDLSRFGGPVVGGTSANPANIDQAVFPDGTVTPVTFAVPEGQDGSDLDPGDLIQGLVNLTNNNQGRWLLGRQERHSAFATGGVELAPSVRTFSELRYTQRRFESRQSGQTVANVVVPASNPFFVSPLPGASAVRIDYSFVEDFGGRREEGDVRSLGGVLGLSAENERFRVEAFASYGRETTSVRADLVNVDRFREALGLDDPATAFDPAVDGYYNPFADGSVSPQAVLDFILSHAETEQRADLALGKVMADGRLFALPGGDVRLAAGAEARQERRRVDETDFTTGLAPTTEPTDERSRDVTAVFGELYVPIVGDANGRRGLRELTLSLAGRYEDYSDFGSSTDPKLGLSWKPFDGLTLRGSYGESFKAPKLDDFGDNYVATAFRVLDPATGSSTGRTLALILQGENDGLRAETSTSWTAGFSLEPDLAGGFADGFRLEATWFDIDFENRLGRLPINPGQALVQEALYAPVITRDPDADAVAALIAGAADFDDLAGGPSPVDYRAVIDARITNIAITRVDGLDAVLAYEAETPAGDLTLSLNASWLSSFRQAVTQSAPLVETLNTLNNPVDLRLRGGVTLARERLSATAFVNYVDSYRNTSFVPERAIDTWTTLDLQLRYDFDRSGAAWLDGVAASLSAQNLLDEDPPLALDAAAAVGLAYDSENADPLGRFLAVQITKAW